MEQRVSHIMWCVWIPLLMACDSSNSLNDVGLYNQGDTVTVMTYNIFHDGGDQDQGIPVWSERRDAVVGTIRSRAPDVLGLQEAKGWQVEWLLEEMPEYAAVARGPYDDPGIDDAETVAILYLRERFELRESDHFWYSSSPDSPGSYGSDEFGGTSVPRMATWVRLGKPNAANEKGFYVFNTHFVADGRADDPGLARFKAAEVLVRRIADRARPDAPFFVLGDFNMGPGAWPLRYLLGSRCESGESCPEPEFRMIDVWAWEHPGDTDTGTRCNTVTGADGMRVDYVLVWNPVPEAGSCDADSGPCGPPEILSADIVVWGPGCPSDHRPMAATIVPSVP